MIHTCVFSLHWLRVQERIQHKLAVLAKKALGLHEGAPRYLSSLVRVTDLLFDEHSVLLHQIVFWCYHSSCQSSVVDWLCFPGRSCASVEQAT